ncbi:unnamed protein product [Microthlaspi erraticum]|uniref:Ubiquitin carboxyl-terminal hydrolase n=1 Tax=Microthlaspi erraticum TaxID=1685480 RepID=A0A6D2HG58_9BRAS|nr:unnamed protein product [Microthlaspi erraticum]
MAEFFQSCDPPQPPSPKYSSPAKTLDESSPTAPIRALVANSLAISSPIRQIQSSPPSNSLCPGESPSPPPSDTPSPPNLDENEFTDSSITPPPPNNSEVLQIATTSFSLDDDDIDSDNRPLKSYIANHDSRNLNFEPAKPFDFSWQALKREHTVTGVGAGLYNSGNTCFIASVLQCFTHTVPLIESLRTYKYPDPCNCGDNKFCVLQALQKHVYNALKSSGFSLRIDQFRDNLNHISPHFQIGHQEDCHEFLQSFLDKLERCCVDRRSQPDSVPSPNVNFVDQIFGGRLMSRLHCCNCDSFSDTFEPYLGYSLEIEDVDDLYSALDSFTCVEKLEDFTCENCKEKVSREKQLKFDKLPPVATFHLKRFKSDGHYMEKTFNHVKFPLELDLLPYMSDNHDPQVPTKYHLYAMVEHFGNGISFGHYSSFVRSAPETWHSFDDANVTKVSEESVLSGYAYMLFYAREGTPFFASAFEELKTKLFGVAPSQFSPKSVLESSPCREESVSDHSYENVCNSNKACNKASVGVPIPGGNYSEEYRCNEPQEELYHSAECSSDSDSPTSDAFDSPEAEEFEKPFAETSHRVEPIAENRAPVDDDLSLPPERKIQNQVPSPKRKAEEREVYQPNFKLRKQNPVRRQQGTFQIQRDHLQNKKKKEEEETRGTKQQPFRGVTAADPKEAEHAMSYLNRMPNNARSRMLAATLGAPLQKKKVSNIKRSTMGLHRNLSERPTNANLGLN